jgi:hypothetical protein
LSRKENSEISLFNFLFSLNLKLNHIIVNLIDKVVLADLKTIQSVIKKALRIKLIEKNLST